MKLKSLLLALIFALTTVMWAQNTPAQEPAPAGGSQARPGHRQQMMEMHKQEMEAMKADMEKMKSSLAQMKTNVAGTRTLTRKHAGRRTWICGKRWLPTWTECKSTWSPWGRA